MKIIHSATKWVKYQKICYFIYKFNLIKFLYFSLFFSLFLLDYSSEKKIKKRKYKKNKDTLSKNFEKKYTKCHQCNKVGKKFDTKKCSRQECNILYCNNCIKKYEENFDKCFHCQDICKCKNCKKRFNSKIKIENFSEFEKEKNQSENKNENINKSFLLEKEKEDIYYIDDFKIIEIRDSQYDLNFSENEKLNNNFEGEFSLNQNYQKNSKENLNGNLNENLKNSNFLHIEKKKNNKNNKKKI